MLGRVVGRSSDVRNSLWTTTYEYNANNQVVRQSQSDEAGSHASAATAVTELHYDALGRQVGVRDANGNLNRQRYDAGGQLVQELRADDGVVRHAYNAFGEKVQTVDAQNHATVYEYNNISRLITTIRPAVMVFGVDDWTTNLRYVSTQAEHTTWDEAGRQTSQTNTAGETVRYRYDLRGNITQTTGPGVNAEITQTAWDAQGRKLSETDANGNTASWTYNYFGRLSSHVDLGGASYELSRPPVRAARTFHIQPLECHPSESKPTKLASLVAPHRRNGWHRPRQLPLGHPAKRANSCASCFQSPASRTVIHPAAS